MRARPLPSLALSSLPMTSLKLTMQGGSWEFHFQDSPHLATKEVGVGHDSLPDLCRTIRNGIVVGTSTLPSHSSEETRAISGWRGQANDGLRRKVVE